jgi:hypothetical protein
MCCGQTAGSISPDFVMNRFYYDYSNSLKRKPSSPGGRNSSSGGNKPNGREIEKTTVIRLLARLHFSEQRSGA